MVNAENARGFLAKHGEVAPQVASEWTGSVALPPAVATFYEEVGPVDVTIAGYGNPIFLPRLAELWDHQAGYRWNVITGEPCAEWDPGWLVVADEDGDPFIWSTESSVVLVARHGAGAWSPTKAYPDLNTMVACLSVLGSVVMAAGFEFTDDDCHIREEHRSAAMSWLTELLGSTEEAEAALVREGW